MSTVVKDSGHATDAAQVRLAANVDTLSIEGHDRDCARAIWSQANLGDRLNTIQVEHLLSIGARSGRAAAQEDMVRRLREHAETIGTAAADKTAAVLLVALLIETLSTPPERAAS